MRKRGDVDKNFKLKSLKQISKETNKLYKDSKKSNDNDIEKEEEITDKDGKKKKVVTHTGPRGGKFYWPDGSPKDEEHKVYIGKGGKVKESLDLNEYLYQIFN